MKKITAKQAKEYFERLDEIDNEHWKNIQNLEKTMKRETGIKDLEFVFVDGCVVGIGTPMRNKKIPLIHRS